MGLDITITKNEKEIFYSRSDYNLRGWLEDFVTEGKQEHILQKSELEDLVTACESCLRNPSLISKLFLSPHPYRIGHTESEDCYFIKRWLFPLRRKIKIILKLWEEQAVYRLRISY